MPKRLIGGVCGFDGSEPSPHVDPASHPDTVLPTLAYVTLNLRMLGRLLNLTEVERMWLESAYRWTRFPDQQSDLVAADCDAVLALLSQWWSVLLESVIAATPPIGFVRCECWNRLTMVLALVNTDCEIGFAAPNT